MSEDTDKYIDDPAFYDFVNGEFNDVAANALLEELAEFAFGDLEAAMEAYEKRSNATETQERQYGSTT